MAHDLFGIPATSTPAERMFSRAGEIFTSHQKCLQEDAARALLNLGSWWGGAGLPGVQPPGLDDPDIDYAENLNIAVPFFEELENGDFRIVHAGGKEEVSNMALEDVAADDGEGLKAKAAGDGEELEGITADDNEGVEGIAADDNENAEDTLDDETASDTGYEDVEDTADDENTSDTDEEDDTGEEDDTNM